MANEPLKKTVPAVVPGGKTPAKNPLDVAAGIIAAKPTPPPAPMVAPAAESVPLFGGHRGGGKKRLDGLPAGSPAAIAADKERDRLRAAEKRAAKKVAPLPPPLPGATGPVANAVAPAAGGDVAVPVAPADVATVTAAPLFVPWGQKLLEKPAKLIGKIVERWRSYSRSAQVKKLKLTPAAEKEVLERMQWREDVVNDFSVALADCATVELNKRRVPGAENSHWINLVMTTGELVSLEMANSALIEKLILEDKAKQAEAGKGNPAT